MHNSFGDKFRITVYGGSHENLMGVVIDGVREGLPLSKADFTEDIDRRRPGAKGTTSRLEADVPSLSGVVDGFTDGGPLKIEFSNCNIRPWDYDSFAAVPRPGHVDYVAHPGRYGVGGQVREFPPFTGGGIFSGRMTLPLVAAGVVAKKVLAEALPGAAPHASLVRLGGSSDRQKWNELLEKAISDGDSLGGVVECRVAGLPVGLGEPYFDSVESMVSHAMFSIPGVRGVEFGDGFRASDMKGSEHNDPFGEGGVLIKNGAGGVNGGLTNGNELFFRVAFKPTSTIRRGQKTWDFANSRMTTLSAKGRHDVCFALRTPVIVEAMTAAVLCNLL